MFSCAKHSSCIVFFLYHILCSRLRFDENLRVRCTLCNVCTHVGLSVNERAPCVRTYVFPLWCAKRLFYYFFRYFCLLYAAAYRMFHSFFSLPSLYEHEARSVWLYSTVLVDQWSVQLYASIFWWQFVPSHNYLYFVPSHNYMNSGKRKNAISCDMKMLWMDECPCILCLSQCAWSLVNFKCGIYFAIRKKKIIKFCKFFQLSSVLALIYWINSICFSFATFNVATLRNYSHSLYVCRLFIWNNLAFDRRTWQ